MKHLAQRAWDAFLAHISEPHPPMREFMWRVLVALIVQAACFLSAICGIGLWYIIHVLTADAYYISDLFLTVAVLPPIISASFGSVAALHSRKFNAWVWRFFTPVR